MLADVMLYMLHNIAWDGCQSVHHWTIQRVDLTKGKVMPVCTCTHAPTCMYIHTYTIEGYIDCTTYDCIRWDNVL